MAAKKYKTNVTKQAVAKLGSTPPLVECTFRCQKHAANVGSCYLYLFYGVGQGAKRIYADERRTFDYNEKSDLKFAKLDAQGKCDIKLVDGSTYYGYFAEKELGEAKLKEVKEKQGAFMIRFIAGKEINLSQCSNRGMKKPFLIAMAKDQYIVKRATYKVDEGEIDLGQDISHASDRTPPTNYSTSDDEEKLRSTMMMLLVIFASGDKTGMANRLFAAFLSENSEVEVFTDDALDQAIDKHENFSDFAKLTLAAPGTPGTNPDKVRIHQALKKAGWDVNAVKRIDDLGVPAFNKGSKIWSTGDFNNGLGVMINGVQYVFVTVEAYDHVFCEKKYHIELKFVLYDVFGLDDDDLVEFGATWFGSSVAAHGITAWWQLQHQFDYAPVLTKAVGRRTFEVSTSD